MSQEVKTLFQNNRRMLDGLLLVVLGAILLLNSLGIIPWGIWSSLGRYWPVLLILAGVSVATHQRVPFLALLVAALIVVIVLAWAFPGRVQNNRPLFYRNHTGNSQPLATEAAGKPITATLNIGAGDITIGGTTDLAFEVGVDHTGPAPTISSSSGANGTYLDARSGVNGRTVNRVTEKWNVKFNPGLPLDLTINAGACDAKLDLSQYDLSRLNISSGASDLDITVGSRSQAVSITISSAASDVKLNLPTAAGVRVKSQSILNDSNFSKAGLTKQGEYWVSQGYDNAAQKIDLSVSGVVGNIDISR